VTILKRLKSIIEESQEEDWWDSLSPAEKEGIQKGLQDIQDGNVTAHDEVMKKYNLRI